MRKIALKAAQAVLENRYFDSGNTTASRDGGVYLHGNQIMYFDNDGRAFLNTYTVLRWPTATTCSRVNDMFRALGVAAGIMRKKGQIIYGVGSGPDMILSGVDPIYCGYASELVAALEREKEKTVECPRCLGTGAEPTVPGYGTLTPLCDLCNGHGEATESQVKAFNESED